MFTTMGALSLNSCATTIHDFTSCAEYPGGALGARCANFLSEAPVSLNDAAWKAMKLKWNSEGDAVECTRSSSLVEIKNEIEKLCSVSNCDQQLQSTILDGLDRMGDMAKSVLLENPAKIELADHSKSDPTLDAEAIPSP